jgi:hypothetical protein
MAVKACVRVDVAIEQLNTAFDLLLNHQGYVFAMTLARATEEILGQVSKFRAKQILCAPGTTRSKRYGAYLGTNSLKWRTKLAMP